VGRLILLLVMLLVVVPAAGEVGSGTAGNEILPLSPQITPLLDVLTALRLGGVHGSGKAPRRRLVVYGPYCRGHDRRGRRGIVE
jgi:hypothetical protein